MTIRPKASTIDLFFCGAAAGLSQVVFSKRDWGSGLAWAPKVASAPRAPDPFALRATLFNPCRKCLYVKNGLKKNFQKKCVLLLTLNFNLGIFVVHW